MAKKKPQSTRDTPREMAAVMFTDVRGYSSLAQRDEALAVRLLDVKQRLAGPLIAKHHGRLIKTIGDALMVEFKSALAATRCAVALQTRLHEHNATRPATEKLAVRIGVHVGDVIRKGDDLLGDTVNLAARVEPEAAPGGIAITQAVYDQIRGKLDAPLVALGSFKLKGMREEVELFAVTLPWEADSAASKPAGRALLTRLKQHHLFRVVSLYATVGWVLILVANQVFPDIGLTREDVRYLIAAVALLFPVAVAVSWMLIPPSRENPDQYGRWRKLRFRAGVVFSGLALAFAVASGLYLWRLDSQRSLPHAAQTIVVLPFDRRGSVDEALITGMQESIENTLGDLGTLGVISHRRFMTAGGDTPPLDQVLKNTGATLVLQGSVGRTDAASPYDIKMELVSADGSESLYSMQKSYAGNAAPADVAQEAAAEIAGPIRFLTHSDDWLAKGYPTTKNPRALRLLHQSLATLSYFGPAENRMPLMRQAIEADPNFAQAYAYLAMLDVMKGELGSTYQKSASVDAEVARALELVPGLPEAGLAPAMDDIESNRWDSAQARFQALEGSMPNNYFVHFFRGYALRHLGRWDEALAELKASSALDPYTTRTTLFEGQVGFAKRDYEDTASYLEDSSKRWPLRGITVFWHAQVVFAERGDVAALARVIDGDMSRYDFEATNPVVVARRIEIDHLEGRHAEVVASLRAFPDRYLNDHESLFGPILGRTLFTDSFTAESLRLLGRDREAKAFVDLSLPVATVDIGHHPEEAQDYRIRVALLEAFGGECSTALPSIGPLVANLQAAPDRWSGDDASFSSDAALVLAWCGKREDAVAILSRSLVAINGAHAAVLAHDPVWRPLYSDPQFKALLAAHGQTLAYAK